MEMFEPLVKKMAYTRSYNSGYSTEDLLQELRLKVLEMKTDGCCMEFPYVKAALQNHINTLIKKDFKNLDSKKNLKVDESILEKQTVDDTASTLEFFMLLRLIVEWGETQDKNTQLIISSFLNPQENLEEFWTKFQEQNKRFKHREMIPLFTIAKYFNINKNKVVDIQKRLLNHLTFHGYSL